MKHIFYTDGSCRANGKVTASGGFGIVEVDENNNILWQYQDKKTPTTNNEMELMAILISLERINNNIDNYFLKPIIYSDSAYCVNLINTWMYSWERNEWKRPRDQEVKNLEIIKKIYKLAHLASIKKVAGHSGIKWNEYADKLAVGEITL